MDEGAGRGIGVGNHDHRGFRVFCVEPLDVGPHGAPVDVTLSDDDAIPVRNLHHDALLVRIRRRRRLVRIGRVQIQAHFLDESGGHNKEDEHDENDVQHGRQIDRAFVILLRGSKPTSHE